MEKNLNEYINAVLKDYEDDKNSGDFPFTEEQIKLQNEYHEYQHKLFEMLDPQQKEVFKNYYVCIRKMEHALKDEYFTLGFFLGFIGIKEFGNIFD
ncbi:MAG: hypothetical protein IJZ35_06250 [Clostridia bacterium]|nr:hypothetical protein [Clostridia bacterium]